MICREVKKIEQWQTTDCTLFDDNSDGECAANMHQAELDFREFLASDLNTSNGVCAEDTIKWLRQNKMQVLRLLTGQK